MIDLILEEAKGFIDRNYLTAYWLPTFCAVVVSTVFRVWLYGYGAAQDWWFALARDNDHSLQILVVIAYLFLITVLAFCLKVYTHTTVRFFEGYLLPGFLRAWGIKAAMRQKKQLSLRVGKGNSLNRASAYARLFELFPRDDRMLLPTHLGNIIRASETYGYQKYGISMSFWWPRLYTLLSDVERYAIEESIAGLVSLLNTIVLLVLLMIDGTVSCLNYGFPVRQWWWLVILSIGIIVWILYEMALKQACLYGNRIRAATDLHHLDVLIALRMRLPRNPSEEREQWDTLTKWLYESDPRYADKIRYKRS